MKFNHFSFFDIVGLKYSQFKDIFILNSIDNKKFLDDDMQRYILETFSNEKNLQIYDIKGIKEDTVVKTILHKNVSFFENKFIVKLYLFVFPNDISFIVSKYTNAQALTLNQLEIEAIQYFLPRKYEFSNNEKAYPIVSISRVPVDSKYLKLSFIKHNDIADFDEYIYHVDITSYIISFLQSDILELFNQYGSKNVKRSKAFSYYEVDKYTDSVRYFHLHSAHQMNDKYMMDVNFHSQGESYFQNIHYINTYESTSFVISNEDDGHTANTMRSKIESYYFYLYVLTLFQRYHQEDTLVKLAKISTDFNEENEKDLVRLSKLYNGIEVQYYFPSISNHHHVNLYYQDLDKNNAVSSVRTHLRNRFEHVQSIQDSYRDEREKVKERRYQFYLKYFSILAIVASIMGFFSSIWGLIETAHNDVKFQFTTLFNGNNIEYLIVFILSLILLLMVFGIYSGIYKWKERRKQNEQ